MSDVHGLAGRHLLVRRTLHNNNLLLLADATEVHTASDAGANEKKDTNDDTRNGTFVDRATPSQAISTVRTLPVEGKARLRRAFSTLVAKRTTCKGTGRHTVC